MNEVFETLNALNVNEHTEKKKTGKAELTYLSWPWAWAEVKKRYPKAHYEVKRFENGLPYTYDPLTGYMVYTSVTIEDVTHEMWLPVMDGTNRAMKSEPYEYVTKYSSGTVAAATMTDINKTIMRCLVKNLAMFGLGLYIYAGEDLPETESDEQKADEQAKKKVNKEFQKPNADGTPTQYHRKEDPITTEQLSAIGALQDTPERVDYYRKALDDWNVTPEQLTYSQGIEVINKLRALK